MRQVTRLFTHDICSQFEAEARAVQLFKKLSLPDPETIGERYPHQVSGGQLQRLMTAMALCPEPDLVVFDEPVTALYAPPRYVLWQLRIIADTGVGALYITHDLAVVAQVSDKGFYETVRWSSRTTKPGKTGYPSTGFFALNLHRKNRHRENRYYGAMQ